MELRHYTGKPWTLHRDMVYLQRVNDKPHGLWVSVKGEDDWEAWNESEHWAPINHAYRITLRAGAAVRRIAGVEQFDDFHREYAVARHPEVAPSMFMEIDWPRVASEHDGVVIAPYLWARRMNPHWYYTWDCASGCIWNLHAIADVSPL